MRRKERGRRQLGSGQRESALLSDPWELTEGAGEEDQRGERREEEREEEGKKEGSGHSFILKAGQTWKSA